MKDRNKPSMIDDETSSKILQYLDNWESADKKSKNMDFLKKVQNIETSDLTPEQIKKIFNQANNQVTKEDVDFFYNDALSDAENYVGLRVKNFHNNLKDDFLKAVYKLAASRLWDKYNVRVDVDQTEGTFIRSYGALLYRQAYDKLDNLKPSKLYGLSG